MKKTRWKLLEGTYTKKPVEELDWLEKVLGPRERKNNFDQIFSEKFVAEMAKQLAFEIDKEIIKNIYGNFSTIQPIKPPQGYIVNIDNTVS